MSAASGKRVALNRLTLTVRSVDALKPAERSWIAWDDRLTGFGVRVQPSGLKSFIVNYRAGDGGRKAPNRRTVLGRHGKMPVTEARRKAREMLAAAARGEDPAGKRSEQRRMPVLERAFEDFMRVNPGRAAGTERLYREEFARHFADWLDRPLDDIARRDVEALFIRLTETAAGRRPTGRSRCCARSTAGPASISRGCATRSICGSPAAASTTATGGAGSPPRRRCCRAGRRASRRRWARPVRATPSGSASTPACGCARCWR